MWIRALIGKVECTLVLVVKEKGGRERERWEVGPGGEGGGLNTFLALKKMDKDKIAEVLVFQL